MHLSISLLTFLIVLAAAGCGRGMEEPAEGPSYRVQSVWGESGAGPGQLSEPTSIAYANGELFVSDAGNSRIQVFDASGRFLRTFGSASLRRPMHLEIAGDRVYVPAYLTDRIEVYSKGGEMVDAIGDANLFDAPAGVAVTPEGNVYVADFFNHAIRLVSPDGELLQSIGTVGTYGTEPGRFTYPTDVALLPDGRLVVGDAYNNRLQLLTADGEVVWMVPEATTEAGSSPGRFNVATAVEVAPDGRIFAADFFNHRIQIFDADGDFLGAFGSQGTGDGQFERPVDLGFDEAGTLYVVDFGNDRIQAFAPASQSK